MVGGTRRFGDTPFVQEVELSFPDPGYRGEYERVLQAPVAFERGRNAMRIDESWVGRRIALQPRYAFGILTRHADEMLERLERAGTMRGRVESALLPVLHKEEAGMEAICARLGCSRDTLYRRLKAEGTTFEAVLDGVRHRLAVDYVAAGKVSINETAYLVGFSDPAAFSRAFKRWTGRSPRQWRSERETPESAGEKPVRRSP